LTPAITDWQVSACFMKIGNTCIRFTAASQTAQIIRVPRQSFAFRRCACAICPKSAKHLGGRTDLYKDATGFTGMAGVIERALIAR